MSRDKVEVTYDLVRYCERMAKKWMRRNKYIGHDDVWDSYDNYDINLYVDDDEVHVTVYCLERDAFGDLVMKTQTGVTLVVATHIQKTKRRVRPLTWSNLLGENK